MQLHYLSPKMAKISTVSRESHSTSKQSKLILVSLDER